MNETVEFNKFLMGSIFHPEKVRKNLCKFNWNSVTEEFM